MDDFTKALKRMTKKYPVLTTIFLTPIIWELIWESSSLI